MAKVRSSDLFDKNVFTKTKDDAKALLVVIKDIVQAFKDVGKASEAKINKLDLGKAEDIDALNKEIEQLTKQVEDFQKVQKEEIKIKKTISDQDKKALKLKDQLSKGTDEQVKAKLKFNKATKAQRDQLKAVIVLEDKEAGTLEKLNASTKLLRLEREKLDIDTKEGKERLLEINDAIDANNEKLVDNSDKLKQNRLQVGGYADGIRDAIGGNEKFEKIQAALNTILSIGATVTEKQADATDAAAKSQTRLGRVTQRTGSILKKSFVGILIAAVGTIGAFFTQSEEGAIQLSGTLAKITSQVGVFIGRAIDFGKGLVNGIGAALSFVSGEFKEASKQAEAAGKSFDNAFAGGLADQLNAASAAASELVKTQFQAVDAARKIAVEIERRRKIEEELAIIQDDDTRGFIERQQAAARLRVILEGSNSALAAQVSLSEDQREIARERALLAVQERAGAQIDINTLRDQISDTKELSEVLLNNQELRGENNALIFDPIVLDELIAAEAEFVQKELELTSQQLNIRQLRRKLLFDEVEQEVDFLIDGTDQIKSANEQRIANEKETLEDRRALLDETIELISNANEDVLQEISRTVDGVEGVDIGRAFDEALDVSDLNTKLKEIGLAEIPINRLLELFREIKTQERDFIDAQLIIDEALLGGTESRERIKNLQDQVAAVEEFSKGIKDIADIDISKLDSKGLEALAKKIQGLEDSFKTDQQARDQEVLNTEIEQITRRLDLAKEGSQEFLDIQEELLNKQAELAKLETDIKKEELDKQVKDRKEAGKDTEAAAKKTGDALGRLVKASGSLLEKRSEETLRSIDDDLSDSEKRQSEIATAIENGSEAAKESLSQERAEQERLRAEREAAIAKEKRQQLGLAALQAYSAKIAAGDPNPVASTIKDALAIQGFVAGLPAFWEGTELVSNDMKQSMPGRDGYLARVDGSERILTGEQNRMMGGISNKELASLGAMYSAGTVPTITTVDPGLRNELINIGNKLDALPRLMPVSDTKYDEVTKMLYESVKRGNNTKTIKRKWA